MPNHRDFKRSGSGGRLACDLPNADCMKVFMSKGMAFVSLGGATGVVWVEEFSKMLMQSLTSGPGHAVVTSVVRSHSYVCGVPSCQEVDTAVIGDQGPRAQQLHHQELTEAGVVLVRAWVVGGGDSVSDRRGYK